MDKSDSVKNVIDLIDNARIAKKKLEDTDISEQRDMALFRRKRKSRKKVENKANNEKKNPKNDKELAKIKSSKAESKSEKTKKIK